MLLRRLRLTNFRQHELTDLAFDAGLTGIVGPNGSGKTTLLEAIAFALYGISATRGGRDDLKRRGAPPRARCEVVLEFRLGAHEYRVLRTQTMAELVQDGQGIANSTSAVTERVSRLLAMDREEFFNTYFTSQKELAVMANMGRTDRAQFLSRVIGYDRLRDAQELLRHERSTLRARLAGIEQGLADPETIEAELEQVTALLEAGRLATEVALERERQTSELLASITPGWVVAQEKRAAWEALDGERRLVDKRVAVAREKFRVIDQQLVLAAQASARVAELQNTIAEYDSLCAEREQLDAAAVAHANRSRALARREQLRRRLEEITTQLGALPLPEQVAELVAARSAVMRAREAVEQTLIERRTRWTEDVQEARTKLDAFRDRYRELKEQRELIEQQGASGICPTCGRPLGKSFASMLELLQRQMDEVETDGKYYHQRVNQLAEPPAEVREVEVERQRIDLELRRATEASAQARTQAAQRDELVAERERLDSEMARVMRESEGPGKPYDSARHETVRNRLSMLEPVRREYDQLAGKAQRGASLAEEAERAEHDMSAAEAALAALDQRLAALGWDQESFTALAAAVQDAERAVQLARFAVQRAAAEVDVAERARAAVLTRQADRAAKAETARQISRDIALLDELDRAYADLRNALNLQLRPDLSDRASVLIRELTNGRYADLELDESYLPVIVEDGEVKAVISGGEEDIVNLAVRLSISQLIAERAGQPLSLLVLDEIFGSLDAERRASVLNLLRSLADRFPQVILITHVEGMQDAFDRVIRMSYDVESGVSVVREESVELADVAI